MLLLQSLSPSLLPPLSLTTINNTRPPISLFLPHSDGNHPPKRRRSSASSVCTVRAVDKEPPKFEVDPDKAREALQKLDQQLQSLSQKKVTVPKKPAPDRNFAGDEMREEAVEFSGSSLAFGAFALLLLTILYNVFFLTVIKPSIDGP